MRAAAKSDVRNVSSLCRLGEVLPPVSGATIVLERFFQRRAVAGLFIRGIKNAAAEFRGEETANSNLDRKVDCGTSKFGGILVQDISFRFRQMGSSSIRCRIKP